MTDVRIFTPENRLTKVLRDTGVQAHELVSAADQGVARQGDAIRAHVEVQIRAILACGAGTDEVLLARSRALAETALGVAEVAGAAGLEAVGDVARGIHATVEAHQDGGSWRPDALRLHIDALALLRSPGRSDQENGLVLERLKAMRGALGIRD